MSNIIHVPGIFKAIIAIGSRKNLADALGVTSQSVQGWVKQGYVPLGRITAVAALTGVPPSELFNPALISKKP